MVKLIYLDNAATTKPKYFRKDYSSSLSWMNTNTEYSTIANEILENCKKSIKETLHLCNGYVLFFRCATEAIEWLSSNGLYANCSVYEHDSVKNCFNVCTNYDDTSIYAHQYVNQLTGDIFDIETLSQKTFFFLSDFTSSVGKVEIPKNLSNFCDAIWFSGHKFYTEKGIGALWISEKLMQWVSNSQNQTTKNQYGLVHGTLDVEGVAMLADALCIECKEEKIQTAEEKYLIFASHIMYKLNAENIKCHYVTHGNGKTHATNALYFEEINADALASYLASQNIYVGLGHSACSEDADYSILMDGYGLTLEEAENVIRISFSKDTTQTEIDILIQRIIYFYNTYIKGV